MGGRDGRTCDHARRAGHGQNVDGRGESPPEWGTLLLLIEDDLYQRFIPTGAGNIESISSIL